jgi:hypothetical protein
MARTVGDGPLSRTSRESRQETRSISRERSEGESSDLSEKVKATAAGRAFIVPTAVDGVWQSDDAVSGELRQKILAALKPLEEGPEEKVDYHPHSHQQVINLLHPSLYCLRIERSVISESIFGLANAFSRAGSAERTNEDEREAAKHEHRDEDAEDEEGESEDQQKEKEEDDEDEKDEKHSHDEASEDGEDEEVEEEEEEQEEDEDEDEHNGEWVIEEEDEDEDEDEVNDRLGYTYSESFAWLPSEFAVDAAGRVTIESCINNLHPLRHRPLYDLLASAFERCLPLLERVLTDLDHPIPSRDRRRLSPATNICRRRSRIASKSDLPSEPGTGRRDRRGRRRW